MGELFFRHRQRAITAVSELEDGQGVIVPARKAAVLFELQLTIGTDGGTIFGFNSVGVYGSIDPGTLDGAEVTVCNGSLAGTFDFRVLGNVQRAVDGYNLTDSTDAFVEVGALPWVPGSNKYSGGGNAARQTRWQTALAQTITVRLHRFIA